jgi:hypothetical protein
MNKFWLAIIPLLLALALTACPNTDTRLVIITDANNAIVLSGDTPSINVPNNSATTPFVLHGLPSNPPAGVTITSYQWTIKLDAGGACNGGAEVTIGTQVNLSWVISAPGTQGQYGGCYVQGGNTAQIKINVTYSDAKVASNSAKVAFFFPPN